MVGVGEGMDEDHVCTPVSRVGCRRLLRARQRKEERQSAERSGTDFPRRRMVGPNDDWQHGRRGQGAEQKRISR
jgi:hypothetical protein